MGTFMEMNQSYHAKRFYFIVSLMLLMGLGILVKLVNIQLVEGDHYREIAKQRTVKTHTIPANRGNIYSSDGSLLATSIPSYTIRFDALAPKQEDFDANVDALSDSLSTLLQKSKYEVKNELIKARNQKNRFLLLARKRSYTDYMRMKKFPLFNKGPYKGGFIAEQKVVREHPIGLVAERTIGYERKDENGNLNGKGIEWSFKDFLNGKDGTQLMQKMAKGQWKPLRDENELEPQDGLDVISTIDVYMQDIAHHALLDQLVKHDADHGCVVVMETKTGYVKAISNLGRDKDGNYFETVNYAINEAHEPGSTFKLVSMMALLEDNLADTSTVFNSNGGEIILYNRKIKDSRKGGYGKISLGKAFEVSSNTVIVQAIHNNYKNNPKGFLKHVYQSKLHEPLDLQIQGAGVPFVPTPDNKNRWYGTSLPWMAWGYGVSITPLHTLTMYNAIANNGVMVKPLFVKEVKEWNQTIKKFPPTVIQSRVCSPETAQKLKGVMENVVKKGTASKLYSKDFPMAGKTGTAKNNYNQDDLHYVSSFVGYFPANAPKYSCIVVIHKPSIQTGFYGADVSGPVFKRIAQKVYTNTPSQNVIKKIDQVPVEVQNNYQKYYAKLQSKYLPNLIGMDVMDAIAIIENLGMKAKINGVGKVKKQSLEPGSNIQKNQVIYLEVS